MAPVDGVDRTALLIAWAREVESDRTDRLFEDPWARRFVDASGLARPDLAETSLGRAGPTGATWVTVRTRFIDDALRDAAETCRQIVVLGAGLDSRAWRLNWPGDTTVFEVDTAAIFDFKEPVLAAAGVPASPHPARRVPVVADVTDGLTAALAQAGHRPEVPTAWVAEGLLLYLTSEQNEHLIGEVGRLSAPGSRLVLTVTPEGQGARDDAAADDGRGWRNPYRVSDGPSDPVAWLARHGWVGHPEHPGRLAARYGRTPLPEDALERPPRRHIIDARRE